MGQDFLKGLDQGWKKAEDDRRTRELQRKRNEAWARAQANDSGRPVTFFGLIGSLILTVVVLAGIVAIVAAILSSGLK